jgi:vancomycin resistance protein YoaR
MTKDELDPFGPKEQTKGVQSKSQAARVNPPTPAPRSAALPPEIAPRTYVRSTAEAPRRAVPAVTAKAASGPGIGERLGRLKSPTGIAFIAGAFGTLFLVALLAVGIAGAYSSKVLPGVKVGSVDVSGLTRDEVMAKLQTSFAYLGQGEVTVTTPVGVTTITYDQMSRSPDVEAMADAAMSVGHSGSLIGDAASALRALIGGQSVPVVVKVDPQALAVRIHQLVSTSVIPPQNAQVTVTGDSFTFSPSSKGRGVDETAISTEIITALTDASAPADLQAGGTFVDISPAVDDARAQAAIASAQKMIVDLTLTWGGAWPVSSATPDASQLVATPTATSVPLAKQTFKVAAATVQKWIAFGYLADGTYGPYAEATLVESYLNSIAPKVRVAPVEPNVVANGAGQPIGLTAGREGVGIDVYATSAQIREYLGGLVTGTTTTGSIALSKTLISPQITSVDKLSGFVIIGSWTTTFYPGESNGGGVNIRLPAKLLNGKVVGPGQQFSFLASVGPIDEAHGWAYGGVILAGGRSDHTGAIGGGICSASTTMFNAAARAGLQIDARHAHFYYINRYPAGLDATVYSNGTITWDFKWTNDTPYPIVIRSYANKSLTGRVTFELWSLPIHRTVTFNGQTAASFKGGTKTAIATATNFPPVYVRTLKPGQTYYQEYPTDGFQTQVVRVVKDQTGATLHTDTWKSNYGVINGQIQIGYTPSGWPTPTPVTTPAPSASVAPRRRRDGLGAE